MIMNAVDPFIMGLTVSHPREHVDLMAFPFHRGGQFGDVNADAAHRN